MNEMRGQLTLRGVVIGVIGCVVITASSVYTALKMGALPWPIVFAAVISLFFLRLVGRGHASLNEANVTHTVMSAGAMVAGGLVFVIPGAWMLGLADQIDAGALFAIVIAGSLCGLLGCMFFRTHFIEHAELEYPIGEAAARTLEAGNEGGKVGVKLFASMGFAGIYCFLRDALKLIPSMLFPLNIPGVTFGIYNSPMSLAVGFLIGTGAVAAWFAGALIANFGIVVGGSALGLMDAEAARALVSCLGMGCMMGCGIAVIGKDILPKAARSVRSYFARTKADAELLGATQASCVNGSVSAPRTFSKTRALLIAIGLASVLSALCIALDLPFPVGLCVVALAFLGCAMAAQSVGQTGIDPMEIFGLIALFAVALLIDISEVKLFFIAAFVSIACGLAGDVMNDFKAGHMLGTSARAQWIGQAIGALVGSVVAIVAMQVLLTAYGADAFGPGREFVAAQSSVVASMVGGISHPPAFLVGLFIGAALYLVGLPSMMIGLGIYLPFYMSLTAFIGGVGKLIFDRFAKRRSAPKESHGEEAQESGIIVASGLLGGESIIGIVLAIVLTFSALGA